MNLNLLRPIKVFFFVALFTTGVASAAQPGMNVTFALDGTSTTPRVTKAPSSFNFGASGFNFGGGALLDFSFLEDSTISLGALYVNRSFSDGIYDVSSDAINLSLVYRYWMGAFSVGTGLFYSNGLNLSYNAKTGGPGTTGFETYGIKKTDYGVIASLAMAVNPIFVEFRYEMDPGNIAVSSQETFRFKEMMLLLGYRYGVGGK